MSTTAPEKNARNKVLDDNVLIQANALNRYYGDYQAVSNFNLTLKKGEVLGLLGPNGAGKSTTMQMLTGNISPSSGDVFINGISLIDEPESAKSGIGYLPEQPPVYRDMTVSEYLSYCAALRGVSKEKRSRFIDDANDRCGLQDVSKKLIGNLSKGFQQRVGIAQAILHKPKVVIFDEPTVGLDPLQINQIRKLISELGEDHAVILSTHILPEVQAVCDRVQIINRGETVFSDSFSMLAERHLNSHLIVEFDNVIDSKLLEKLVNVEHIKILNSPINQNRYQLDLKQASDLKVTSSAIYELSVEQGWGLLELSSQKETLEQIFMDLVYTDSEQQQNQNSNKESSAVTKEDT